MNFTYRNDALRPRPRRAFASRAQTKTCESPAQLPEELQSPASPPPQKCRLFPTPELTSLCAPCVGQPPPSPACMQNIQRLPQPEGRRMLPLFNPVRQTGRGCTWNSPTRKKAGALSRLFPKARCHWAQSGCLTSLILFVVIKACGDPTPLKATTGALPNPRRCVCSLIAFAYFSL